MDRNEQIRLAAAKIAEANNLLKELGNGNNPAEEFAVKAQVIKLQTTLDRNYPAPEKTTRQRGEDIGAALVNSGYTGMPSNKDFINGAVDVIRAHHRTLQQNAGRTLIDIIKGYAKAHDENDFDDRNKAFAELSSKLKKELEYEPIPYI